MRTLRCCAKQGAHARAPPVPCQWAKATVALRISSSAKAAHSKALVALSTAKQLRAAQMGNGACKPACKSAPRECITREAKVQAKNNANSKPPPDQSRRSHGAGHMRRRASGRPATPFVGSKFPTGGGGERYQAAQALEKERLVAPTLSRSPTARVPCNWSRAAALAGHRPR